MSLISSFEISVRPNASRIKYPATTIAIIIKPEMTSLMIDFFASGLSGLIISLLFINSINYYIILMLTLC